MALACLDGTVLDAEQARIPVTDEGLLRGDGVFEVIRLYGGLPFALDDHLARLERSAQGLRLPIDAAAVRADVEALLGAGEHGDAALRVLVTRGGRRVALVEALPDHRGPAALATVTFAPSRILDQVKSLSYAANMLATRIAVERGADEALLTTPHGRMLETPTGAFFYVLEGSLRTPPLSDHVLDSITRRRLLELVDVDERPAATDELPRIDAAFVASTTREVQAVARIDDRSLDVGHDLVVGAAARLAEHVASTLA